MCSETVRNAKLGDLLDASRTQHLLEPEWLMMRLRLLDTLDALIGDLDLRDITDARDLQLIQRAKALRLQLEAANDTIYDAAHAEIKLLGRSPTLEAWLYELLGKRESVKPQPGLGFDLLDEIVCGVLQLRGPNGGGPLLSCEMTPYQPTPARHILDLIAGCGFVKSDVLVDLGAGLGHVPLLVSILTGIPALGVEVQPDHAASAQEAALRLNLGRVAFIAEDARTADLSVGTVFYMFTPFIGSILMSVLDRLHKQSKTRQIKVCTLGPCARIVQDQTWLRMDEPPVTGRVAIFRSR